MAWNGLLARGWLAGIVAAAATGATVKQDMDALTGGQHTRVVWHEGGSYFDGGGKILGYDSQTDRTVTILPEQAYRKPILCTGGSKVVVTSDDWKVYVVAFAAGAQKQYVVNGFCSDVWVHPQTGKEWLFVRDNNAVRRHLLENPSQSVLVYSGSAGHPSVDWYSVSADGTAGADFLPWDAGYYISNAAAISGTITTKQVTSGCWASMSCDNSYYWFHLTGDHSKIQMFFKDQARSVIQVTSQLTVKPNPNNQIYHPRFASKGGDYFTFSAGYSGNALSSSAEIYLGRFNSSYTGLTGTVCVTKNSVFDANPDAWVGVSGATTTVEAPHHRVANGRAVAPDSRGRLVLSGGISVPGSGGMRTVDGRAAGSARGMKLGAGQ